MVLLKELFEEAKRGQSYHKNCPGLPKIKKETGKTGFFRTTRVYCQSCKKKHTYQYIYFDENGVKRYLSSVDFLKLREKVLSKELDWFVESNYLAKKTAKKVGLPLGDLL